MHRGNAIRVLYSLSGSSGELPASCIPQEEVVGLCALAKENLREVRQEGFRRIPQGGTREIWRGTWRSNRVAVKVMKLERRNSAYSEMLKEVCFTYHSQSLHNADPCLVAIVRGDDQLEILET